MQKSFIFKLVSALTLSVFLCQNSLFAQPQPTENSYLAANTLLGDTIDRGSEERFANDVRSRFAIEGGDLAGDGIRSYKVYRLRAHEDVTRFQQYLTGIVHRLRSQKDPGLEAVVAFQDVARRDLQWIEPTVGTTQVLAAFVSYGLTEGPPSQHSSQFDIAVALHRELFEQLSLKAGTDQLHQYILDSILIKEGTTILDMERNPQYYIETNNLLDVFERDLSGMTVTEEAERKELVKRATARLVEVEAVGFRAALAYFERKGITPENIGRLIEAERESSQLAVLLTRLHRLLMVAQKGNDRDRAFFLSTWIFLGPTQFLYPKLAEAFTQIVKQEGAGDGTHETPVFRQVLEEARISNDELMLIVQRVVQDFALREKGKIGRGGDAFVLELPSPLKNYVLRISIGELTHYASTSLSEWEALSIPDDLLSDLTDVGHPVAYIGTHIQIVTRQSGNPLFNFAGIPEADGDEGEVRQHGQVLQQLSELPQEAYNRLALVLGRLGALGWEWERDATNINTLINENERRFRLVDVAEGTEDTNQYDFLNNVLIPGRTIIKMGRAKDLIDLEKWHNLGQYILEMALAAERHTGFPRRESPTLPSGLEAVQHILETWGASSDDVLSQDLLGDGYQASDLLTDAAELKALKNNAQGILEEAGIIDPLSLGIVGPAALEWFQAFGVLLRWQFHFKGAALDQKAYGAGEIRALKRGGWNVMEIGRVVDRATQQIFIHKMEDIFQTSLGVVISGAAYRTEDPRFLSLEDLPQSWAMAVSIVRGETMVTEKQLIAAAWVVLAGAA